MKRVIVRIVCFCSILLVCLTGCGNQQTKDIKDKLNSELEYVEDLIFKVANKYAKKEYLEEDKMNWQWIKNDVGKLNSAWGSLVLDLTEVNVKNQDIIDFSSDLNNLLISLSNEDSEMMIKKLDDLYKKVIIFKESYLENKNEIHKNKIKSDVLNVYSLATQNDWASTKTQIENVIENYKNLMNDISYAEENSYNLNKIYVLLEEYKVSILTQNYDLVRMKYIIAIENL